MLANRRDAMPSHIPPEPELKSEDSWYLSSFFDLSTDRAIGMGGVGPIPYQAIISYCEFWEFDQESSEIFIRIVRELDSVFLAHTNRDKGDLSRPKKRPTPTPKRGGIRPRARARR